MNYWVVGADWDGDDKTEEFISQGVWKNGYSDKFLDTIDQIQVGDWMAIKSTYRQKHDLPFDNFGCDVSCMKIKAIGKVIENLKDGRTLQVKWAPEEEARVIYYYTYRQTASRIANKEVQDWIFNNQPQPFEPLEQLYKGRSLLKVEAPSPYNQNNNTPKNQILFGPAGTGKTYHTVSRALEILEPSQDLASLPREQIKQMFDEHLSNGRIQFVTFHQSFSYEDFVEGIQAKTNQAGQIVYQVESGIFKQFCMQAQPYNYFSTLKKGEKINGYEVVAVKVDSVDLKKHNGNIISFSKNLLSTLIIALLNKSITIDDIKQKKAIEKLALLTPQTDQLFLEPYIVNGYNGILSQLLDTITTRVKPQETHILPYVLIIDEINRGNISRVFGELITLIEESKREGAEESLSVVLPYSKTVFSVPDNVYIIGTMNSSDRSLTGLDIALRRRFTFIEMQPDPSQLSGIKVDGVDIEALLTVINQRIEVLLDRDHCIGHAYFMPLTVQAKQTVKELGFIFKQKIIPLLQEYFYDDWERIDWVLGGNGMVRQQLSKPGQLEQLFPRAALGKVQNHCWQINPTAQFDSDISLYQNIINIKDNQ